jgi:hypothetical protein
MKQKKTNWCFKKGFESPKITAMLGALLFIGLFLETTWNENLYCKSPRLKYYRDYSPDDYDLQPQNWCILQGHRGIIYAANQGGLLEYDGVSWKSIIIPNKTVRSLAIDNSGTIYVGGVNEIGFLEPNLHGRFQYKSFIRHLTDRTKKFGSVWKTHTTEENVFFRTSKYLFRWSLKQHLMEVALESKDEDDGINGSFISLGKYFVNKSSVGLMQWEKESFKLINGGERFASVKTVFMVVPYDTYGKKLLIGTREKGFFIYDGQTVSPFPMLLKQLMPRVLQSFK